MIISYLEYLEIPARSWHMFFYDEQDGRWKGCGVWRGNNNGETKRQEER